MPKKFEELVLINLEVFGILLMWGFHFFSTDLYKMKCQNNLFIALENINANIQIKK